MERFIRISEGIVFRVLMLVLVTVSGLLIPNTIRAQQWATYVGVKNTNDAERFNFVFRLPDETFLVTGSADNLNWAVGVPVTVLDTVAAIKKSSVVSGASSYKINSNSTKVAFIAHFTADMRTITRIYRFPANTVEDVNRIRTTAMPWGTVGEFAGAQIYISGKRKGETTLTDGYYIAKLNNNFVDGAPTGISLFYNADCAETDGDHEELQPWDVDTNGDVILAEGASMSTATIPSSAGGLRFPSNQGNAFIKKFNGTTGNFMVVENWLYHTTDNGGNWQHLNAHPNPSGGVGNWSAIRMKSAQPGSLRSYTASEFLSSHSDENGYTVYGKYPDDLFFTRACEPGNCPGGYAADDTNEITKANPQLQLWVAAGYTGYRHVGYSHRIGDITIDRRNNHFYVGYCVKTLLPTWGSPTNFGDFEPAVVAFEDNGKMKWYRRLYNQNERSTPDQYVDAMEIDYANDQLVVVARAHGNNNNNLWKGNQLAFNPSASGFQNQWTGTNGNIHIQWIGKYNLGYDDEGLAGRIMHATYWGEYLGGVSGAPHPDPNLDGWVSPNSGWNNLNTTRNCREIFVTRGGSIGVTNEGRRTITTKTAFQKMIKPATTPTYPSVDRSTWNWFARVYTPDLSTLRYSTLLTGAWNPINENGGNNTTLGNMFVDNDTMVVVGYHERVSTSILSAAPNPIGDASVDLPMPNSMSVVPGNPTWSDTLPFGETAILARLGLPKEKIRMNVKGKIYCQNSLNSFNYRLPGDVSYKPGDVFTISIIEDSMGYPKRLPIGVLKQINVTTATGKSVSQVSVPVIGNQLIGSFNGTSTYISAPHNAIYNNIDTNITVSAWVKTTDDNGVILQRHDGTSGFRLSIGTVAGQEGRVVLSVDSFSREFDFVSPGPRVNDDQWTHIAATYDGTNAYFFINGQYVGFAANTSTLKLPPITAGITIGRQNGGTNYYAGRLRLVQLWDSTLLQSAITNYMFDVPYAHPKLLGAWDIDEGSGSAIADGSSNANNGTGTAMFWADNGGFYVAQGTYWVTCDISGSTVQTSDTVEFEVSQGAPPAPGKPTGLQSVCKDGTSRYTVAEQLFTESYYWELSEFEAGNLVMNGTSATVSWNSSYPLDTVSIYVRGFNSCGGGAWGDTLQVKLTNQCVSIDQTLANSILCPSGASVIRVDFKVPDGVLPLTTNHLFDANNQFVLQLSDNAGTFDPFFVTELATSDDAAYHGVATGLGSVINASTPYFELAVPPVAGSDLYRLRVVARDKTNLFADPTMLGSELAVTIEEIPSPPAKPYVNTTKDKFGKVIVGYDYKGDEILDYYVNQDMGGECATSATTLTLSIPDSAVGFPNIDETINQYANFNQKFVITEGGRIYEYETDLAYDFWRSITVPATGKALHAVGQPAGDAANRQWFVVGDDRTFWRSDNQVGADNMCTGTTACNPFVQIADAGFTAIVSATDDLYDIIGTRGNGGLDVMTICGSNGIVFQYNETSIGGAITYTDLSTDIGANSITNDWYTIATHNYNSIMAVAGANGKIAVTTNGGTNWNLIAIPGNPTEAFYDLVATPLYGEYYAVGENGLIVRIQDAYSASPNVEIAVPVTSSTLRGIAWTNGRGIIVGDNNVILQNTGDFLNIWEESPYGGLSPATDFYDVRAALSSTGPVPTVLAGSNGRVFETSTGNCQMDGTTICSMGNSPNKSATQKYRGNLFTCNSVEGAISYTWSISPPEAGTIAPFMGIDTVAEVIYDSTYTGTYVDIQVAVQTNCVGLNSPAHRVNVVDCDKISNVFEGDTFCAGSTFILDNVQSSISPITTGTRDVFAELSDNFGSFADPLLLGLSGNCGGCGNHPSIAIPPDVPDGDGYKLRIRKHTGNESDYPNLNTPNITSNPVGIVILGGAASVTLTPSPALSSICPTTAGQETMSFTTPSVFGARQYEWTVTPDNAGTWGSGTVQSTGIVRTDTTVKTNILTWNTSFVGTAYINIAAISKCGKGSPSASVVVSFNCTPPPSPTDPPVAGTVDSDSSYAGAALLSTTVSAPPVGQRQYRTRKSGVWSDPTIWERFDGANWVRTGIRQGGPSDADDQITVRTGHTVYVNTPDTSHQVFSYTNGNINRIEFESGSSTDAYAVGDGGVILQTNQTNGNRFNLHNSGTTADLNDVSVHNEANAYIAGDNGTVLYTTNGNTNPGATYAQAALPGGLAVDLREMISTDANTLWAATSSGIFYSSDGGSTWTKSSAPGNNTTINYAGITKFSATQFIATTSVYNDNNGYSYTANTGTTWAQGDDGNNFRDATSGVSAASATEAYSVKTNDRRTLWRTTNNGTNWVSMGSFYNDVYAVGKASADNMIFGGKNILYHYNGSTFTNVTPSAAYSYSSIAVAPNGTTVAAISTSSRHFYISTNSGASFGGGNNAIQAVQNSASNVSAAFSSDTRLFISQSRNGSQSWGVAVQNNNGSNWTTQQLVVINGITDNDGNVRGMDFIGNNGWIVGNDLDGTSNAPSPILRRIANANTAVLTDITVETIVDPIFTTGVRDVKMITADIVFFAMEDGKVIRTLDATATTPTFSVIASAVHPLGKQWYKFSMVGSTLYLAGEDRVYYSSDVAGNYTTWSQLVELTIDEEYRDIVMVGSDLYLAADGEGLLKSTNSGTVWAEEVVNTNFIRYYDVEAAFGTPAIIYAVGENGQVTKTTNTGGAWTNVKPTTTNRLNELEVRDAGNFVLAVGNGGTIVRSTNGGTNWTYPTSGTTADLNYVFFIDDNTGWIAGANGVLLKTTNGGANWTALTSGVTSTFNSVHFATTSVGFAMGNGGLLLKSTDGGTSWFFPNAYSGYSYYGVDHTLGNGTNTGNRNVWVVGEQGTIMLSTGASNGTSYTLQTSGTTNTLRSVVGFANTNTTVADDRLCVVGDNGTILTSANGGTTWTSTPGGLTLGAADDFKAVHGSAANNLWIVGANNRVLKNTAWPVVTWTDAKGDLPVGITWNAIFVTDANNAAIGGDNGKRYYTTNGGTNWIERTGMPTNKKVLTVANAKGNAAGAESGNIWMTGYTGSRDLNQVVIQTGATLIENDFIQYPASTAGAVDLDISGTYIYNLRVGGSTGIGFGSAQTNEMMVRNGGVYTYRNPATHGNNQRIRIATWLAGSTLRIEKTVTTNLAARQYYNIIWDCIGQNADLNIDDMVNTLQEGGTFTVENTGPTKAGYGATFSATTLSSGVITDLALQDGGSGYVVGETPYLQNMIGSSGGPSGYSTKIRVDAVNGTGAITGFTLLNGGSAYTTATLIADIEGQTAGGSGGKVAISTNASGQVTGFSLLKGGTGYTYFDNVRFTNGAANTPYQYEILTDKNGKIVRIAGSTSASGSGFTASQTAISLTTKNPTLGLADNSSEADVLPTYPNFVQNGGHVTIKSGNDAGISPLIITNKLTLNGGVFYTCEPSNSQYVRARAFVSVKDFEQNGGVYRVEFANAQNGVSWNRVHQLSITGNLIQNAGTILMEEVGSNTQSLHTAIRMTGTATQDFKQAGDVIGQIFYELDNPDGVRLLSNVAAPFCRRGGSAAEAANPHRSWNHLRGDINLNGFNLTTRFYNVLGSQGLVVGTLTGPGMITADSVRFTGGLLDNTADVFTLNHYHTTRAMIGTNHLNCFIGNLRRRVPSGATTDFEFPIAEALGVYKPITLKSVTFGGVGILRGSVHVSGAAGAADNNPTNLEAFSNKPYWQLRNISGANVTSFTSVQLVDATNALNDTMRLGQSVDAVNHQTNGEFVSKGIIFDNDTTVRNDKVLDAFTNVSYLTFSRPAALKPIVYIPAKPSGPLNPATEFEVENLTKLAQEYNASIMKNDVNVYVTDAYNGDNLTIADPDDQEYFPIIFRQNVGAGYKLNIMRHSSSVANVVTADSVTGSAEIQLNGADNITFDGRVGGVGSTSLWTFRNRVATGSQAYTFRLINDAQNNVIRYLNIEAATLAPAIPPDTSVVYPPQPPPGGWIASGSPVSDCRVNGPTGTPAGRNQWHDSLEMWNRAAYDTIDGVAGVTLNTQLRWISSPNGRSIQPENSILAFNDSIARHYNTTSAPTARPVAPVTFQGYNTVLNTSPHPWCRGRGGMTYTDRMWVSVPGTAQNSASATLLSGTAGGLGYSNGTQNMPHNGQNLISTDGGNNNGLVYWTPAPTTTAQFTLTTSGGKITNVAIANGGSGYKATNGTANGTIGFYMPGTAEVYAKAVCIATVTAGVITNVQLVSAAMCLQVETGTGRITGVYTAANMMLSDAVHLYNSPTLVGSGLNPLNYYYFDVVGNGGGDLAHMFVWVTNVGTIGSLNLDYEQLDMNTSTGRAYPNGQVWTGVPGCTGCQIRINANTNTGEITSLTPLAGTFKTLAHLNAPRLPEQASNNQVTGLTTRYNFSTLIPFGDYNVRAGFEVNASTGAIISVKLINPSEVYNNRVNAFTNTLQPKYDFIKARYDSADEVYDDILDQVTLGTFNAIMNQSEAAIYLGSSDVPNGGNSGNTFNNLYIKGYSGPSGFIIGLLSHNINSKNNFNRNNTITGCRFEGGRFRSIHVGPRGNGGGWVISKNHIYAVDPKNTMIAENASGIHFEPGPSSVGNTIDSNYIGGTTVLAGRTAVNTNEWSFSNARYGFKGIYVRAGSSDSTKIHNNIIRKFNIPRLSETASEYGFRGIDVEMGLASILGNQIGNVGDTMWTQMGNSNGAVYSVYGISSTSNSNVVIRRNRIEGLAGFGAGGGVAAISYQGNGAARIENNTINNLISDASSANRTDVSNVGIRVSGTSGFYRVVNNNISRLTAGSGGSDAQQPWNYSAGILIEGSSNGGHISGNRINRIQSLRQYPVKTPSWPKGSTLNGAGWLWGIVLDNTGTSSRGWQVYNNMISITNLTDGNLTSGRRSNMRGIVTTSNLTGGKVGIYHNSVFIGGYTTSGAPAGGPGGTCAGIFRGGAINWACRNNLVVGASSIASGSVVGIGVADLSVPPITSDYNTFIGQSTTEFIEHTTGVLKPINTWQSTQNDLQSWTGRGLLKSQIDGGNKTNYEQLNYETMFVNALDGDLHINPADSSSWFANGKGIAGNLGGTTDSENGVLADIDGNVRGSQSGFGVDIGADEFTPNAGVRPPAMQATAIPAGAGDQYFNFGGRRLVTITWQGVGTKPSAIVARQYTGEDPMGISPTYKPFNMWYSIRNAAGNGSGFKYQIKMAYSPALLGKISQSRLDYVKIIKRPDGAGTWVVNDAYDTPADQVNLLFGNSANVADAFTSFSEFSGTDTNYVPLSITLLRFTATLEGEGVMTRWSTANEINNSHFTVERSLDGRTFTAIGEVKGAGNSRTTINYQYPDKEARKLGVTRLYYRLISHDFDGKAYESQVAVVDIKPDAFAASVFPNPFADALNLNFYVENAEPVQLQLFDLFGAMIIDQKIETVKGANSYIITADNRMAKGVYFIRLSSTKEVKLIKLVRE